MKQAFGVTSEDIYCGLLLKEISVHGYEVSQHYAEHDYPAIIAPQKSECAQGEQKSRDTHQILYKACAAHQIQHIKYNALLCKAFWAAI